MNTETIELICEKLGTTIENLVPAVIEYLTHRANVGITIGAIMIAVGVLLVVVGFMIEKHGDGFLGFFIGGAFLLFGGVVLGVYIYSYHLIVRYPEFSAYQEILKWLR